MSALEDMATALDASEDYRVLRRLASRVPLIVPDGTETRLALAIDVETTGLDTRKDEIIELAMVPFTFSPADGRIFEIREPFHALRQPNKPIPPEITEITGIDDAMVAGHVIDPEAVAAFVDPAVLIVAHHAGFDRPFAERFHAAFKAKCWSCSMTEIDWRAEGRESTKLAWLLAENGLFYRRHRSVDDCHAMIQLLASPLPKSGVIALAKLLDAARQPTWRIWATGAPFEAKDVLKARGYRWNPGDDGRPKAWYFDAGPDDKDGELAFLRTDIYRRLSLDLRIDKLTAFERFSDA